MGIKASLAWKTCIVHREHATSSIENAQRRMDILIELDGLTIAIENKPWAGEQYEQLHDYVTHLDRRFAGNFVMIYLSSNGTEPTSISAVRRGELLGGKKLLLCAYCGEFRSWLKNCYQVCNAEKMRWFLSDFIAFIEQEFPAKNPALNQPNDG